MKRSMAAYARERFVAGLVWDREIEGRTLSKPAALRDIAMP